MCIDGPRVVSKNEIITYASKTTIDDANLQWITNTEGVEILNIENSIDIGMPKSIATLKFNSNFNGGTISVIISNDDLESTTNYPIELQN